MQHWNRPVSLCLNIELKEHEGFLRSGFYFILEGLECSNLTVHIGREQTVAQVSKTLWSAVKHCRSWDSKSPKQNYTILDSIQFFKLCVLISTSSGFINGKSINMELLLFQVLEWRDSSCFQREEISHLLFLPVGRLPEDAAPLWNRLHPPWDPGAGERCVSRTSAQPPPPDHWCCTGTRGYVMVFNGVARGCYVHNLA